MLKLKLQYLGHLMWRADSFEKTLMLGNIEVGGEGDNRGWDGWMVSPTQWTWVWVSSGSWWWTGRPGVLQSIGSQRVGHDRVTKLNWTENHWCTNLPSSLVAQIVKTPPAMQKTWAQSLGQEDPLRRDGFPLQYSSLKNSMNREAWRATVFGVSKSWTQLSD